VSGILLDDIGSSQQVIIHLEARQPGRTKYVASSQGKGPQVNEGVVQTPNGQLFNHFECLVEC